MFGLESVILHRQIYRTFHFSHLINISIFGIGYGNLRKYELVWKTNKRVLIHLASLERIESLLTLNDLCASNVSVDGLGYSCCGKVNIRNGGRSMIGYVVNETDDVY